MALHHRSSHSTCTDPPAYCPKRIPVKVNSHSYESVESMIENEDDERLQHYLDLIYE
jgi:hypothetical protein